MCLTRQKISGHDSRSYSHDLWNDEEKEKTKKKEVEDDLIKKKNMAMML